MHLYNPTLSRNSNSDRFLSLGSDAIIIASAIISISFICAFSMSHLAIGQQASLNSSVPLIKVLVGDAIQALDKNNTTKMIQNLNVVNQMLIETKENSSSIQAAKLLLHDTIQAVNDSDVNRALVYLDLLGQQFGNQQSKGEPAIMVTTGASNTTSLNSLTYEHPILGITMQYPHDWTVRQYEYNPAANNTLVGFYSPSKTASELGTTQSNF